MSTRKNIFVSYSHKDKKLFDEFKTMLAPAIQSGLVDLWDDQKIPTGSKWREEIQKALSSARVAVLLVSQNFLASHFIAKEELPPLLEAAKEEGVTIFWIYLSSCLYEQTEIGSYQAAHDISRPLDRLSKPQRQAVLSEACFKLLQTAQQPAQRLEPTSENSLTPLSSSSQQEKHLECCLLLMEALECATTASYGGGPTTTLHRRLNLAKKWLEKGAALLPDCRDRLPPELAGELDRLSRRTLPSLISETRFVLPEAGESDEKRGNNDHFQDARAEAHYLEQQLKGHLSDNAEFHALRGSGRKWLLLEFNDREDYEAYLYPTVTRLAQSADPMQRDLFERLLEMTEFTPRQLAEQGFRKDVVMDSLNALLAEKWAVWMEVTSIGANARGRVTEVGKRLLRQLLDRGDLHSATRS
jgi:hypothetical protein